MTGLGTDIVRRDEIRLIEDTDGDGYADKATVVATGFNSIQGLAYHDGTLFVMHAPFLSAVPYPPVPGKLDQRGIGAQGIGAQGIGDIAGYFYRWWNQPASSPNRSRNSTSRKTNCDVPDTS